MVKEIYCKLPTDIGYEHKIETNNEIQCILQQIRMVLGTKPGDVLGAPGFGLNLNQFLFDYNRNMNEIRYLVNAAIGYYIKFDSNKYAVGCEINYGHNAGDPYEYAVIDIYVNQQKTLGVLVNQADD